MMKETKDLVILTARLGNGISLALKDGKFDVSDIAHFGPVAAAIPAALAGMTDIPAELTNALDADREELVDIFCTEFSISSEAAELMIEKSIALVVALWNLIK